jgi:peptide/nickel transport system permease protein
MNRWDSPWLNPKFLIGLGMVLLVISMSVLGPVIWNTDLARVASSPLNLPPAWVGGTTEEAPAAPAGEEIAAATATSAPVATAAATESAAAEAADEPAAGGITGGNPFAQQQTQAEPTSATDSAGSMTGGNPFASQQTATDAESGTAVETATPASFQSTATRDQIASRPSTRSRFGEPSWDHPLGTESSGRDMLAVLLVGAPRSLWIGMIAAGIGMIVGITLGFTAGFMGGWVDTVIRTLSDAFITIPSLAVLIVISAFVSFNNITYMALMLALFAWPGPTRLLRSQVLSMRERGYVQMARLSGASVFNIMFFEMMPNLLPYLAASFTGNVSGAILAATGLEVLGLGPTRIPTLGITIFYAIRAAAILRGMWWWWGIPIAALILIFTGLFLMTVGLDEIANPRLRGAKSA